MVRGYTTDVLTARALEWLKTGRDESRPFLLCLSYKAVHYPFEPAPRHDGRYHDKPIDSPETRARTERKYRTQPNWIRARRYSIHGIDHMETGPFDKDPVPDLDDLYRGHAEAVHSLDENVGRVVDYLVESGLSKNTLVIYTSDNGFHLGEHGFYDKRDAFETSIRVPMLAWAPGRLEAGTKVQQMVQNVDLAPTILDAMGVETARFDGRSALALLRSRDDPDWRTHLLYEYHWEWNSPATPTQFAIRTDRYKYVYYHGTWDIDSFHDLQTDPDERHNLIAVPAYKPLIDDLRTRLFRKLESSGALNLPLRVPAGDRLDQRKLPD